MEIDESKSSKDTQKNQLLRRLNDKNASLSKNLALAITIQTMYSQHIDVLIELFEFHISHAQLDLAVDLFENDILKNFDLSETELFDTHINAFVEQITYKLRNKIYLSPSKQTTQIAESNDGDSYFQLFSKLSLNSQEKLIGQILKKLRNSFSYLNVSNSATNTAEGEDKKPAAVMPLNYDMREFYLKLAASIDDLFKMKSLILIYKNFLLDYGIFLIDGFLNIEKQLYSTLAQNNQSTQSIDTNIYGLEKRSLNVIRSLCVVHLIPDMVRLVEKIDNRHCYRWIEKSLEFFTKYTVYSIQVNCQNDKCTEANSLQINYSPIKLIHVSIV
jgi:hypothetical protein